MAPFPESNLTAIRKISEKKPMKVQTCETQSLRTAHADSEEAERDQDPVRQQQQSLILRYERDKFPLACGVDGITKR